MNRGTALGLAALGLLAVPGLRHWLEADMARHMLIEFPLLIAAGWALGPALPAAARRGLDRCNAFGLAGWTFISAVLGFWMIPAALDAALAGPGMALGKYAALIAAGAVLRASWTVSPLVVQAFFVGNIVWMMATVGMLYQDATQQLCLYYLADAQVRAGRGLVLVAIAIGAVWVRTALRRAEGSPRTALQGDQSRG